MKYFLLLIFCAACFLCGCDDYVAPPPAHPYEGTWYLTLNSSTSASSHSCQRNITVQNNGSFSSVTVDGRTVGDSTTSFKVSGKIDKTGLMEGLISLKSDTTRSTSFAVMIVDNRVNASISSALISNPVLILAKTP